MIVGINGSTKIVKNFDTSKPECQKDSPVPKFYSVKDPALIYCSLTEGDKLLLSRYLSLTTERRILSYHNLGCFTFQVLEEDLWLGITLPSDNPDFSAMFLTDYLCYINPGLRAEDIEVIVRTEDWLALKSVTVGISPDGTALPPVHSLLDLEDVLGP